MDNYSITVIQDEAVPLASMPNFMISDSQWVFGVVCVALLIGLTTYIVICWNKKKKIVSLQIEMGNTTTDYCLLDYFKLKAAQQELQYQILERQNIKDK